MLKTTFGKKRFRKFYEVMKNISFSGLNYRNTDINTNGEIFFLHQLKDHYVNTSTCIFFDVGANTGQYSRKLFEVISDGTGIYAFEPFSGAYRELELLKNEIQNFHPFKLGLSEKTGKMTFFSSNEFNEIGGLYNRDFPMYNFSTDVSEEATFDTIENFCANQQIPRIHFLKIDVEGHDFFVLKGARAMIDNNQIDFIQFEFGSANYLSKTYLYDFFQLLSPNYRVYKLLRNGLIEIPQYNTDIEIHILSNYIAINRGIALNKDWKKICQ